MGEDKDATLNEVWPVCRVVPIKCGKCGVPSKSPMVPQIRNTLTLSPETLLAVSNDFVAEVGKS